MLKAMNVTSSLAYEVLFYLNYIYLGAFALCEVMLVFLKAWNINYPIDALLSESCLLVLLCLVELLRIYLGRRGNLVYKKAPVLLSILLTVPAMTGIGYLLLYQTYIVRLEYIFGVILLLFQVLEVAFGIIFLVTVCKQPSQ